MNEEDKVIVLGDFNHPNIRSIVDENDNCLFLVNLLETIEFKQVIPTSSQNGKWLDIIDEVDESPTIDAE